MAEKNGRKKKGGLRRKLAILLLMVCVVLALATLSTMGEDGTHFASLRRWLMYGGGSETSDMFVYETGSSSLYGALGDGLLAVTPHTIQYLLSGGEIAYELSVELANPQLTVGKHRACVCDIGGNTLYLLD